MQSNPSYNIGIGGGLQDDYSQYSNYGPGGSSSSGRYHNQAGGGYDTEYGQQYRTSGGLQTTDDFSYYQRHMDNSGTFVVHSVYCPQCHTCKLPSCRTCCIWCYSYVCTQYSICDRLRINRPLAANIEFTLREFKVQ